MINIGIIMEMRKPGWADEESLQVMLFGLLIIGGLVVSLVGLVLGITGLVQPGRSKVFPVLGLGLNAVIIVGVIGIIVIGVLSGG
jgi:hypothetical protein